MRVVKRIPAQGVLTYSGGRVGAVQEQPQIGFSNKYEEYCTVRIVKPWGGLG